MVPFQPLRIPAEILSEIFRIFVIEDGGSPWTLTKVSRAFRRTALGTPRIWGGISLWGEEKHGSGAQGWYRPTVKSVRWEFGKENCCTAKQLRQALKRARAAPLDLAIKCRRGYPIAIIDKAKEMIRMVAGERVSQWRSLEFAVEDNWDLRDIFSGSLEALTFLRLDSFHRDLYDCLCKTARNLRNVEIHMRNQPLSKLAKAPWWQHVHRLLLEVPFHQVGGLTTGVPTIQCASAVNILSKAVALEDLTIQVEHYNQFVPTNKPLHFPRMKKLVLRSSDGLLPTISAPLLTHVEIRTGSRRNGATLNPGSIFLPAVTHLSVFSSAPPVLACFYCPSLVQLCLGPALCGHRNDPIVTFAWSPDNDPEKHLKPSILRIESLDLTWTVLRDLLRFSLRDCLRDLSFIDCPLPKSFFKALMAVAPSSVICKDLEELSVIYTSDIYKRPRIMGWDDGKAILKSIFTLRRKQNLGLRRVIAQWRWPRVSRVEFSE